MKVIGATTHKTLHMGKDEKSDKKREFNFNLVRYCLSVQSAY